MPLVGWAIINPLTIMALPNGTSEAGTSSVLVLPQAASNAPPNVVAVATKKRRREQVIDLVWHIKIKVTVTLLILGLDSINADLNIYTN